MAGDLCAPGESRQQAADRETAVGSQVESLPDELDSQIKNLWFDLLD
jgi:hypothetical protein